MPQDFGNRPQADYAVKHSVTVYGDAVKGKTAIIRAGF